MRLALCNEVLRHRDFVSQCDYAVRLGYDGLEVAPFTLSDDPPVMPLAQRVEARRVANEAGLAITGLHWLLVKPEGLSITSADAPVRARSIDAMRRLIELCADLGGRYLVHGSPAQRRTPSGVEPATARAWIIEAFAAVAPLAEQAGVVYLIEPLPVDETDQINTLEEATALVRAVASPAVATVLDTKSAALAETASAEALVRQWLPTGVLRHVQLNDRNRRAPGQGGDHFGALLRALADGGYDGDLAVEPFDYVPDGDGCAAFAAGYVRGALDGIGWQRKD